MRWLRRLLIVLLILSPVAGVVWWKLFKSAPQELTDAAARFHYGSLGGEWAGIPYPILFVLPRVFPDLLPGPGGWSSVGLAWEEGERLPIGFAIKRFGMERVSVNCAFCHTTRWRLDGNENPRFAEGGASHTFNVQAFLRFLFATANDHRFTASRLLPEMAVHFRFDWFDWLLYKFAVIPATRTALQVAEEQMAWMEERPDWGPGRTDAFNLPKFVLNQSPWDDTVGATDIPALWGTAQRDGGLLHVAGEAADLRDVVESSAIGIAAWPLGEFDTHVDELMAYIGELEPPTFPASIDAAAATAGSAIFADACATCHAPDGARVNTAIPLAEVGTDPERALAWDDADGARMTEVNGRLGVEVAIQGAQGGYVARPLVGLWLLGPYLHNGSVPTLADLLKPPAERPTAFYSGYDVVDLDAVGFVSGGPDAERDGFHFDTTLRGNANSGHNYGTDLSTADRAALLEYLKTR